MESEELSRLADDGCPNLHDRTGEAYDMTDLWREVSGSN
jgi:hypothetical protein